MSWQHAAAVHRAIRNVENTLPKRQERYIAELERQIEKRNAIIAEKNALLAEQEQHISELKARGAVLHIVRDTPEAPAAPTQAGDRIVIPAESIKRAVAKFYGLEVGTLTGPMRLKRISRPRHVACYLLSEHTLIGTLNAIGRIMGGRDHSTIHHSLAKIETELKTDPQLRAEIAAIRIDLGLPVP